MPRPLRLLGVGIGIVVLVLGVIGVFLFGNATTRASYMPITATNVNDLELGYALPGSCGGFNDSGSLLATDFYGVYDMNTAERRFSVTGSDVVFDHTGRYLLAEDDGVYSVSTGERIFELPQDHEAWFSPGGQFVFVQKAGAQESIYETATGASRFDEGDIRYKVIFSNDDELMFTQGKIYEVESGKLRSSLDLNAYIFATFSPDKNLLMVDGQGVYDTASGEKRFAINGYGRFSPNSTLAAVRSGVDAFTVFNVTNGEKLFTGEGVDFNFSPNSAVLSTGNTVYDLSAGQPRFVLNSDDFRSRAFSPDSTLLLVEWTGIFDVASGTRLYEIPRGLNDGRFSPDGRFLAVTTNRECLIYGPAENTWLYRSGLVETDGYVLIYSEPNGELLGNGDWRFVAVMARTADSQWYKTVFAPGFAAYGWIPASEVSTVHAMPDDLPVENP